MEEPVIEMLAEGESFNIWRVQEEDGELTYHLELGVATLHLFQEEWQELVELVKAAAQ